MNVFQEYTKCSWYIVKHPQLNATTNLFGGQLLAWLDEATAIYASTYMAENRVVTARLNGLDFQIPTELGMVVTIWAKVIKEGNSSLTLEAVATKRRMGDQEEIEVAKTTLVFVAIDDEDNSKVWKPERFTN
jgi:acyl-CoA thioesterase YciA